MAEKPLVEMIADMKPEWQAFLRGLLDGEAQTDAYQAAYGCERKSAESSASDLVRNPKFRAVYTRAVSEAFPIIDGLKALTPRALRQIARLLESENESIVLRVIENLLDRTGVAKTEKHEHSIETKQDIRSKLLADLQRGMEKED